ncbi:hypothetical protein LCGC14_0608820 [marine sediment metagenome]|uniref:Uncharacterized protein n=1 Tax=marine sediment metagenome TaxID=412755 RepID=A0A0F9TUQ1_9ZZZZ
MKLLIAAIMIFIIDAIIAILGFLKLYQFNSRLDNIMWKIYFVLLGIAIFLAIIGSTIEYFKKS